MVGFVVVLLCHANELPVTEESAIHLSGSESRGVKRNAELYRTITTVIING